MLSARPRQPAPYAACTTVWHPLLLLCAVQVSTAGCTALVHPSKRHLWNHAGRAPGYGCAVTKPIGRRLLQPYQGCPGASATVPISILTLCDPLLTSPLPLFGHALHAVSPKPVNYTITTGKLVTPCWQLIRAYECVLLMERIQVY